MNIMANKKVKRRLNIKGLFVILLTLYLFIMLVYYVFTMPIKTIVINGNNIIKDKEIIEISGLTNYPSLFGTSTHSIKKKIKTLDLIENVKIKKNINGTLTIDIKEEKVLFLNKSTGKYALSNNKEVLLSEPILGIPVLVNYTSTEIYEDLIKKMSKLDEDIIALISEIEYSPDVKDNITIDEYRFYLRMNDGNRAYINIANFDRLQEYKDLFSTVEAIYGGKKGTFNLDVIYTDGNNVTFKVDKEGDTDELPE